jgi:oligopeptidase B
MSIKTQENKVRKINQLTSIDEPVAKRLKTSVKFGKIDGEDRGDNLMDPFIEKVDDYYWLRDDKRESKDVLEYLNNENSYTDKIMEPTKELQEQLYNEIKSRIKEDDETYPYPQGEGGWFSKYRYFTRTLEGKSYPIYCRKNMLTQKSEVYLDVNELATGHSHCDVSDASISPDHKILAYSVDFSGNEKYDVYFKDLETDKLLDHKLTGLMFSEFNWAPDSKSIFYCMADKYDRVNSVWRYDLDTKQSVMLFEENDALYSVGFEISENGQYLFIESSSADTSECYYMSLPDGKLNLIHKRVDGLIYRVGCHENNLIILTNKDNCVNFKLMFTEMNNTDIENWQDIRPYNETEYINGFVCFKNYIAVSIRHECFKSLAVIDYDSKSKKYDGDWQFIKLSEKIFSTGFGPNCVYDTNKLWFSYTSLTLPDVLYEYDMQTKKLDILRIKEVPNYDPKLYESKLIYAPSYYGVQVPIALVYRKDMRTIDKPQPLHLYAYGSYGLCIEPSFDHRRISLLDRGFVYGIAYIRGGGELGYNWYLDGKMYNKMNTFLDFISCGEYLVRENYTKPSQLVIHGRSAGGLLMGAAMTMRPDLFGCVIAGVPFVDVLTTMADPSIPLTTGEWIQWGNPNKREDYTYMRQYSPYDNIRKTNYPDCLILAGLHDPRVQYWEPAKFMAKLREYKTNKGIHLLKTEMNQGHFGGSDRYKYIREIAYIYAFMIYCLNKNNLVN